MAENSAAAIVAQSKMSRFQIISVGVCVFLNALDGFDVLSMSFAAPGIVDDWGVSRTSLGIVLSMELIGMAAGSIFLGRIADAVGRRPTLLGCLIAMTVGMASAAMAGNLTQLAMVRFLTGIGIGGVLATSNAMAAEYSNLKQRSLAVSLMATGYPVGAIIGGAAASSLLAYYDWRIVFWLGAFLTAMALPATLLCLPESIEHLSQKQPRGALGKINKLLKRMGHAQIKELPPKADQTVKRGFTELFSPRYARATIILTLAYFLHILTFYFILKWTPKIVSDIGFSASLAGGVLVWANVGGAIGAVLLGFLSQKVPLRTLVIFAMVSAFITVSAFGSGFTSLHSLSIAAAAAGFFTNSAIVGLYALFVQIYPAHLRAGGTGFVIGFGRGGAALGPILAGYLFQSGQGLQVVSIVMALGSFFAAMLLLSLRRS